MDLSEIASVSGKGGLFKVLNPTRTGVILESMDEAKKKMIVSMQSKVSVLSDISVYSTDGEGSVPLSEVFKKIHKEFSGETGLDRNATADELKSFLKFILPNYDEDRVYVSDIKKVVAWYNYLSAERPELFVEESKKAEDEEPTKVKRKKKSQTKPDKD